MSRDSLLVDSSGGIARLTLNRPAVGNAFDLELARRLRDAVVRADADPGVGAIVVRAEGRLFCAGGDVAAMDEAGDTVEYVRELARTLAEAMRALSDAGAVTIAEVDGAAAGAGLGLVLNVDLVLAGSRATFLSAYAGVGFVPDAGVSRRLPEIVGPRRARELALAGTVLTADEALRWGLVNRVLEDPAELRAQTEEAAARIVAGPRAALAATKRLLDRRGTSYADHLEAEIEALAVVLDDDDTRRRLAAFVARRR